MRARNGHVTVTMCAAMYSSGNIYIYNKIDSSKEKQANLAKYGQFFIT